MTDAQYLIMHEIGPEHQNLRVFHTEQTSDLALSVEIVTLYTSTEETNTTTELWTVRDGSDCPPVASEVNMDLKPANIEVVLSRVGSIMNLGGMVNIHVLEGTPDELLQRLGVVVGEKGMDPEDFHSRVVRSWQEAGATTYQAAGYL